jgi:hypothetical protein
LTSIIDRNSLQRDELTNPGTSGSRQMVWRKTAQIEAWACTGCAWTFRPSGPPLGDDLDEMMENYEVQRDKEYARHVCAQHPRTNSKFSGRLHDRTNDSIPAGPRGRNDARGGL